MSEDDMNLTFKRSEKKTDVGKRERGEQAEVLIVLFCTNFFF